MAIDPKLKIRVETEVAEWVEELSELNANNLNDTHDELDRIASEIDCLRQALGDNL